MDGTRQQVRDHVIMRGACEAECTRRNEALRRQVFGTRVVPDYTVMQC